jgi:hypothetical protein
MDDVRSFMVASQPPIPFGPQGLVALYVLYTPASIELFLVERGRMLTDEI